MLAGIVRRLIMVVLDQWLSCATFSPHGCDIEPAFTIPKGDLWDGDRL
jgi:hypothetical protein